MSVPVGLNNLYCMSSHPMGWNINCFTFKYSALDLIGRLMIFTSCYLLLLRIVVIWEWYL